MSLLYQSNRLIPLPTCFVCYIRRPTSLVRAVDKIPAIQIYLQIKFPIQITKYSFFNLIRLDLSSDLISCDFSNYFDCDITTLITFLAGFRLVNEEYSCCAWRNCEATVYHDSLRNVQDITQYIMQRHER